jgi:hypothetical protein
MRKRSLLSFALLLSLLAIPGMAQTDPKDEEPTIDDVAGIWKASEGVLYTTAEDQEGVLAALNAKTEDGKSWTAPTYNVDGTAATASLQVVLVDAALLPAILPNPGDQIPCPHPNHILYRNSVCGYTNWGFSGLCQALPTPPYPPGTSRRTSYNTYRSCKRQVGPTYCVNVRSIIGWTQYFDNGNCTGAVTNMQSHFGWTCN